jgi:hypothetical protein
MENVIQNTLEKLGAGPGQGSVLEKIDKIVRAHQRKVLWEMLKQQPKGKDNFPVALYRNTPQIGKKQPAMMRLSLPKWRYYDEVFWQALGDYIILALHRVKDVDYDASRGVIKIEYFDSREAHKSPQEITEMVRGLALLIDEETLPTDFTRLRRMAESRGSLGEMKKEQALAIGAVLKLASLVV